MLKRKKNDLRGVALRKHIILEVTKIMTAYAPLVGVTKKELAEDVRALKNWNLTKLDWFFVYDALASSPRPDIYIEKFYRFARDSWRYGSLARDD